MRMTGLGSPGAADLGPFLEAMEQRLQALSSGELRTALLTHATRLPAAERTAFLAILTRALLAAR
jgi:hypothetical protein